MARNGYRVAVVGATGAVGTTMVRVLEERNFPVSDLKLLASSRSVGKELTFRGDKVAVEELTEKSFEGVDVALFSAGASVSRQFAPIAARSGCVVVDNSSAFRMDPQTPLVVPEVNPHAVRGHQGIIANPNCSTIQMVVALKPIQDAAGIKRIVVTTFQAVSGTGMKAIEELRLQVEALVRGEPLPRQVYPHQIAFNCLPHIGSFLDSGYTEEEMKMVNETRKIFEDPDIQVCATTVRVPVYYGHSESVAVETRKPLDVKEAVALLKRADGVQVVDEPLAARYPMPLDAAGRDETFVGRIRKDISVENGLVLWIVADNIRKGAATNAVQIAELLVREKLL
ncbi:aspartate semialdehyde dehydrogenase [Desulfacinum infernum DSM 9756]|jgi:aspartate-semialdehyde dehydrogenase|uniref:Aspartate-semialdehyde dehydrogenase n=1 Tax=Desulfacinum infernum DSM 9756 TaxID=1121391 RepID=A0A1M5G292_9BACT|nr:aspartate-semialdehyde dehydrogenase [Desulfacinum infernum]SHF97930.1 aspartate semialdehyde dehydrogenase [Desulfacinum infernum DSM 9756]